jgi:hypothetical protein
LKCDEFFQFHQPVFMIDLYEFTSKSGT